MSRTDRPDPLDEARHLDGDLPDGVDPSGVPTSRSEHQGFVLAAAIVVALLALIFTLSWIVYHQLNPDSSPSGTPSSTEAPR
ncbi:MAG: hypothetical protein WAK18_09230 [Nocardioidaceae bacterium]